MVELNKIKQLIARDRIDQAFDQLLSQELEIEEEIREEGILIRGRLEAVNKKISKGIISEGESALEQNKIRADLLDLISKAKNRPIYIERQRKNRNRWVLIGIVYAITAASLIWFFLSPKRILHIYGQFQVSRVDFFLDQSATKGLFEGQNFNSLRLQNFEALSFRADSLRLDLNYDKIFEKALKENRGVTYSYIPGIQSGIEINSQPLILEKLYLADSMELSIRQPKEGTNAFQVFLRQQDSLKGRLSFNGKTDFTSNIIDLVIEDWGGSGEMEEAFTIQAIPAQSSVEEVRFNMHPRNASIELRPSERIIEKGPIYIRHLQLIKKEQSAIFTSIKGGKIIIAEPGGDTLDIKSVKPPAKLSIIENGRIEMSNLELTDQGIFFNISADVKSIDLYDNQDKISLKPPLYMWMWHNWRTPMIAIGIAIFLFIFFLPGKLSEKLIELISIGKGLLS